MKFTGERVVPGQVEADLLNEHLARYHFARQFVAGKRVLDAACGSGYGSAMLAESASSVVGIDISHEAVRYARDNYAAAAAAGAEIDFSEGDCLALPLTDESIDVAVAFEIVEHLKDAPGFLRELRRVLRPGGVLLLSTPNHLYYTKDRGEVNPFHEREYTFAEVEDLIAPFFAHRRIIFENHVDGFAISGPGAELNQASIPTAALLTDDAGAGQSVAERARDAYFFIAVCSAMPIPPIKPLLYVPSTGNVLRERETHIHLLESQLADAIAERDSARERFYGLEKELNEFREFLQKREGELTQMLADRTAWAQGLEGETNRAREAYAKLEEEFTALRSEFEVRTAWALRLNGELAESKALAKRWYADLEQIYDSRWQNIGRKFRLSPSLPALDSRSEV